MAISGSHCRFVPTAGQTHTPCRGGDSRARHCTCARNRLSIKWQTPPNCHSEERSDVGISQYPFGSQGNLRRKRNCLHEIAPQGHFLALRAQGATAPLGPRNDKPLAFTVLSAACTGRQYRAGSGMPFPATRHEGLTSNENIRLTAGPRMLYTDTGGPQPVRLQENPPSQKFRREEKCERKPSGCPFAFHHPPQRQNCKIMLQKLILQF